MIDDFDFDRVYSYIENELKNNDSSFYSYNNYQLHLKDRSEIILKKNFYTLSKIVKGNGVFSLSKKEKDNGDIVNKTNELFYKILLLVNVDT